MSETASISSSIASRYAQALFDIALDEGALDTFEGDIDALREAFDGSEDLRSMINDPIYSRCRCR